MDVDLMLAMGAGAVAAAILAYVIVRTVFRLKEDTGSGGGVRALLAVPAVFVARRRSLDIELSRKLDQLERLRVQAGGRFLEGATAPEIFVARFVFPALAITFFTLFGLLTGLPGGVVLLVAVIFGALLYVWPESALKGAASDRSRRFTHDLPMALNVMRLVTLSGGDLYGAIRSVIAVIGPSPVREELARAVNEVAIGTSLAAALTHVGERVATAEANAVFSTLAQALEMGTSVSANLGDASELIRHGQRVKAQEKAQKAVVSMTFPLLLLILPGVFIVLFAPMIIKYMNP